MYLNKRKVIFLISIFLLIFIFNFNQTKAQELRVVDGDTIHLDGIKIRFSGIDTPELKQNCLKNSIEIKCGIEARDILINKIGKHKVSCISEGIDQFKRTLAECFVNNISLSSFLVRSGYAFAYRKYSKKFISDEEFAKFNKLGMWNMEFEFPWNYRRLKQN
jgi:endonuclease YncB( thermonuclease family)